MNEDNRDTRAEAFARAGEASDKKESIKTKAKGAPGTATSNKVSKKVRRKREQRKQLMAFAAIVVVVAIVGAAIVFYNKWKGEQVETLPQDQRIVAVVNGQEQEIAPYSTCEIDDKDCKPGKPVPVELKGAKEFTLKIPHDVSNHDWSMLKIYNDPGANQDNYFRSDETQEVKLKLAAERKSADGSTPSLKLIEIRSLLVGLDADKKQTPVNTIWSIEIKE